jgi:uncharacterized membrane protein HdeD (DUF308 family)
MNSTQHKRQETSRGERSTLIASAAIMGTFVLFVCIASSMSLAYYTIAHGILTLAVVTVLIFGTRHKTLTRAVMILGVIGALSAVLLFTAYLPYYTQHINYMNSLR